jgi:hypothetical protein
MAVPLIGWRQPKDPQKTTMGRIMVFNVTFNNISVILWQFVEKKKKKKKSDDK